MRKFYQPLSFCFGLLLTFALAGCGSDEVEQQTVQADSTANPPAAPGSSNAGMEEMYAGSEYGESESSNKKSAATKPELPPRPPRPEDVRDWTSQHITSAIEERDLKVKEALEIYTDAHRGEDESAQEVVAWMQILLQPPVEPPKPKSNRGNSGSEGYGYPGGQGPGYPGGEGAGYPGAEGPGGEYSGGENPNGEYSSPDYPEGEYPGGEYPGGEYPGGDMYAGGEYSGGEYGRPKKSNAEQATEEIAESLIDSLFGLQSLTGYQAARELLSGQIALPIDEEKVARHTLTALLRNIQSPNDPATKILRQTMIEPKVIREAEGDFDSRRLQNVAMEEHWKNALAVMDGVMGVASSEISRQKKNPNNMGGEYGGEGAGYPGAYPGGYPEGPGGPGEPQGEGNNRKEEEENVITKNPIPENLRLPNYSQEQATAARHYVWSNEMVEEVSKRLKVSDTLMREPELLLMAGQIPATSSRYALQQFLAKNWMISDDWTRNAVDLVKHDVFKNYMRDPGLLIAVKSLPREQQARNANGPGGGGYEGAGGGEYGGEGQRRPQNRAQAGNQQEAQAKGEWFKASEHLMLSLMDRMHHAAHNRTLPQSDSDELDVRLHRNAVVTLDSRLEIVLDQTSQDPEEPLADKTVVNYVRIELDNLTPQEGEKIYKHYVSSLRGEKLHPILSNNGMWMESTQQNRLKKEIVSVDVLLSRNGIRKPIAPPENNRRNGEPPGAEQYGNQGFNPPPGEYGGGEYGGGGGQGGFVVEILTVRIPDPEEFLKPAEEYVSQK